MKSILFSFLFLLTINLNAQKTVFSKEYGISLTVPNDVYKYETEAVTVLGYESEDENLSVDIEVFNISEQLESFIKSQKNGAVNTAKGLGLKKVTYGGIVPNIKNAHYAIAHDYYDGEDNLVYVIAAINPKKQLAYEITIYMYDNNTSVGKDILNSFRLIN
ncbi:MULTISPECIES: hypothetical protein [unclassified Winogradskyella]|uniref:hypothetical protein n=1 Tax=unclassified Winogradskyella TaxID=2615021 RepID=UPI0012F9BABF|nr:MULTISPECIES: hypothetical protein [unclassified Winogradskyella]